MSGLPVGSRVRPPKRERLGGVDVDTELGLDPRELPGKLDQTLDVRTQSGQIRFQPQQSAENVVEYTVLLRDRDAGRLPDTG